MDRLRPSVFRLRTEKIQPLRYDLIASHAPTNPIVNADAIINDYAVNAYISDQRGNTEVVQLLKTNENYGIGVRKGNAQMVEGVNKALAAIMADGTYKAIYKKWFGVPSN